MFFRKKNKKKRKNRITWYEDRSLVHYPSHIPPPILSHLIHSTQQLVHHPGHKPWYTLHLLFVNFERRRLESLPRKKSSYVSGGWAPSQSFFSLSCNFRWQFLFPTKNLKSNISDLSLEEANLADSSPSVESPEPFTSRYVPCSCISRCQPLSFSRSNALT